MVKTRQVKRRTQRTLGDLKTLNTDWQSIFHYSKQASTRMLAADRSEFSWDWPLSFKPTYLEGTKFMKVEPSASYTASQDDDAERSGGV